MKRKSKIYDRNKPTLKCIENSISLTFWMILVSTVFSNFSYSQIAEFEGKVRSTDGTPEYQLYDDASSEQRIEGKWRENNNDLYFESLFGSLYLGADTSGLYKQRLYISGENSDIGVRITPKETCANTDVNSLGLTIRRNAFTSIGAKGDSPKKSYSQGGDCNFNENDRILEVYPDNYSNGNKITARLGLPNNRWNTVYSDFTSTNNITSTPNINLALNAGNQIVLSTNFTNRIVIENNGSWKSGKDISTSGRAGCVFLGDSNPNNDGTPSIGVNDQFVTRFNGGYYFMTSGNTSRSGILALSGANAWSSISDVNKKENFEHLDDVENLEKLTSVDYTSWNYKDQDPETFRHYGIMAQEFYALFGQDTYGTIGNDTLVNPIDMIGVTMSALKGASIKIDEQKSIIDLLQNNMNALRAELLLIKKEIKK